MLLHFLMKPLAVSCHLQLRAINPLLLDLEGAEKWDVERYREG
jgi:hypothetical protein